MMRKPETNEWIGLAEVEGARDDARESERDVGLYELLSALGIDMGVERAYVFDFEPAETDGDFLASQRAEWVEVGETRQIANPALQNFDMAEAGFGDWIVKLSRGEGVVAIVADLPERQREVLWGMQGIRSIAFVPIFARGKWVGAIGVDACLSDRVWTTDEIETLRKTAERLGERWY